LLRFRDRADCTPKPGIPVVDGVRGTGVAWDQAAIERLAA
jgi:hypothetical protein